jgi:hypothetical protein
MMNNVVIGLLGAGAGLLVAVFGNVVILPYVLRHQERRLAAGYRDPILGWDKDQLAAVTRTMYRVIMPVFFGLMGANLAVTTFGANP